MAMQGESFLALQLPKFSERPSLSPLVAMSLDALLQ